MAHTIQSGRKRLLHQLYVLVSEELRELVLRKRALLSLLLYVGVIGIVVVTLAYVERKLSSSMGTLRESILERSDILERLERHGLRREFELVSQILSLPSPVVIVQLFSLIWFPTLVALVSCDMITIDIYRGTLRFIVMRTSRTVYYFSKLFAHYTLYLMLHGLTLACLLAVCAWQIPDFTVRRYVWPTMTYLLVFLPFLWFVVATTQFVSCWSNRPMNAIIRLHLLWVVFFVLLWVNPWLSPVNSSFSMGLMAPFEREGAHAVIGMSAWALLFTWGGLVLFRRRGV